MDRPTRSASYKRRRPNTNRERTAMRPSSTNNNGNAARVRTRGAIRTHLGRKRTGPRSRALRDSTLERIGEVTGAERHRQEQLFDRLLGEFQSLMSQAGETTMAAVD